MFGAEHNPIAELVTQIQSQWVGEISELKKTPQLVRFLVPAEQFRLYDGFLKLECSEHGQLPEVFITLLTSFENEKSFPHALVKDWTAGFLKDKTMQQALANDPEAFKWPAATFQEQNEKTSAPNELLLHMLQQYQQQLSAEETAVYLVFRPYIVTNSVSFIDWIDNLLQLGLPDSTGLLVLDDRDTPEFDHLFKKYEQASKTIYVPLDYSGAVEQLASGGDANDPEVQFRKCLIKINEAQRSNDLDLLNKWGGEALLIAQQSGDLAFMASSRLIYAAALFHFKEFAHVDKLLKEALLKVNQGMRMQNDTVKPLLIQIYGFQGASAQHQKQKTEAIELYERQAEKALEFDMNLEALMAWQMALALTNSVSKKQYQALLNKVYLTGRDMDPELLKISSFPFVAFEQAMVLHKKNEGEKLKELEEFMILHFGSDWKTTAEEQKKQIPKKSPLAFFY